MARAVGKGHGFKTIVTGLGALVSFALIAATFGEVRFTGGPHWLWKVDPAAFLDAVPRQLGWFVPFLILAALQLPARAVQWGATLRTPVELRVRYHCVAIGAFVHNALPGKLGDLTRAWLLGRETSLPFVEVLGSVAVCKLLEFVALVGLGALTVLTPQVPPALHGPLRLAGVSCVGLCLGVFVLARLAGPVHASLRTRGTWPRLARFFRNADTGLVAMRRPRPFLRALALSVLPVLAGALGYGWALHGLGLSIGWVGGPVVLLAIAVGQSVLIIPAGVGLYFASIAWVTGLLGATPAQAAMLAALTEVALLVAQCGLGAASLWMRGMSLGGLRVQTAEAVEGPAR